MFVSTLVSVKIVYALAKDMVNFEAASRLAPNLLDSSKRWLQNSIQSSQIYHRLFMQADPSRLGNENDEDSNSTEYIAVNWLEGFFCWLQIVILWRQPLVTIQIISLMIASFELLTYYGPRFYATISLSIFFYNLFKFYFRHLWPAIRVPPSREREEEMRLDLDRYTYLDPELMTLNEFKKCSNNLISFFKKHLQTLLILRQRKPVSFCIVLCFLFHCTAIIGSKVSGMRLIFLTLTILLAGTGIYVHLLSERIKLWLKQNVASKLKESGPVNLSNTSFENMTEMAVLKKQLATRGISMTNLTPGELLEHASLLLGKKNWRWKNGVICEEKSIDIPLNTSEEDQETSVIETTDSSRTSKPIKGGSQSEENELRNRRRRSSDLSSNDESETLIELDDQNDGFVML